MKYVGEVEDRDGLKAIVVQDLKENGIKVPKVKKQTSKSNLTNTSGVFGNHLCNVPCQTIEGCGPVPIFLVDAFSFLEEHLETEGLFRKSGSLSRQKELKIYVEKGCNMDRCLHVFDATGLIKQFLRELPDPLITMRLHDTFIKAYQENKDEKRRLEHILMLCILLPWEHLSTLRYTMRFLAKVAKHSEFNKMSAGNIAVCLTPNLMYTHSKNDKLNVTESKLLEIQTSIVELLIENGRYVGMVTPSLEERSSMMKGCFGCSEDELDVADDPKSKKKKRRSGSLQGILSSINNSLGKWRGSAVKTHTTQAVDKAGLDDIVGSPFEGGFKHDQPMPEATPKMMRKRKASGEELVPFSASKRKAILQNMPNMGTPFTPARRAQNEDIPPINFAEDSDLRFSATPCRATPQRRSIGSPFARKKRYSGGFSPKTPKTGKRRSMKGLFRRLSGGKESSDHGDGAGHKSPALIGSRLAHTNSGSSLEQSDLSIQSDGGTPSRKRLGIFAKKNKKVPCNSSNSPALDDDSVCSDASSNSSQLSHSGVDRPERDSIVISNPVACKSPEENISDIDLARQLKHDLIHGQGRKLGVSACNLQEAGSAFDDECDENEREGRRKEKTPTHVQRKQRARSLDTAAARGIRRGAPNTVCNGLLQPGHHIPSPIVRNPSVLTIEPVSPACNGRVLSPPPAPRWEDPVMDMDTPVENFENLKTFLSPPPDNSSSNTPTTQGHDPLTSGESSPAMSARRRRETGISTADVRQALVDYTERTKLRRASQRHLRRRATSEVASNPSAIRAAIARCQSTIDKKPTNMNNNAPIQPLPTLEKPVQRLTTNPHSMARTHSTLEGRQSNGAVDQQAREAALARSQSTLDRRPLNIAANPRDALARSRATADANTPTGTDKRVMLISSTYVHNASCNDINKVQKQQELKPLFAVPKAPGPKSSSLSHSSSGTSLKSSHSGSSLHSDMSEESLTDRSSCFDMSDGSIITVMRKSSSSLQRVTDISIGEGDDHCQSESDESASPAPTDSRPHSANSYVDEMDTDGRDSPVVRSAGQSPMFEDEYRESPAVRSASQSPVSSRRSARPSPVTSSAEASPIVEDEDDEAAALRAALKASSKPKRIVHQEAEWLQADLKRSASRLLEVDGEIDEEAKALLDALRNIGNPKSSPETQTYSNASSRCTSSSSIGSTVSNGQQRRPSASNGPNLKISMETHKMLSRVGYMPKEPEQSGDGEFVSVPRPPSVNRCRSNLTDSDKEDAKNVLDDSVAGLAQIQKVTQNVRKFKEMEGGEQEERKDPAALRFNQSCLKKRGSSPVRIPTIFAKSDKEADKFRQMALNALGRSPACPPRGKANLPISTPMLQTTDVQRALNKIEKQNMEREEIVQETEVKRQDLIRRLSIRRSKSRPSRNAPANMGSPREDKNHHEALSNQIHEDAQDSGVQRPLPNIPGDSPFTPAKLSQSLVETITDVCTPKSQKTNQGVHKVGQGSPRPLTTPLRDSSNMPHGQDLTPSNNTPLPFKNTPVIKQAMFTKEMANKIRTPGGMTPRHLGKIRNVPGRRYRSPVKPVKRLGSPNSPRSPIKSPKKLQGTPMRPVRAGKMAADPSAIPDHVFSEWAL